MRRGFTLIECIIAMFVLAVGFVAVASLYPIAYRGATVSSNQVLAMEVASGLLAHIRSNPYGTPVSSQNLAAETQTAVIEGVTTSVTFTKSVKFARGGSQADTNANADVALVTVSWTEGTGGAGEGRKKSVTVTGGVCREP